MQEDEISAVEREVLFDFASLFPACIDLEVMALPTFMAWSFGSICQSLHINEEYVVETLALHLRGL